MQSILNTIGNTPLVKLRRLPATEGASVYVKLEYFNPTASYKDRMALAVIGEAERRGTLRPGMTVVENTAGSTGTSLALVCAAKGYAFHVVSSNAFSPEKLRTMRLLGAELELIDNGGRGITPDLVPRIMERAAELSKDEANYWTRQFENLDVLTGYKELATEISAQIGRQPDVFCAGVGTAGMFAGVAAGFGEAAANIRFVALEPASAPLLTKGIKGTHNVEGIAPGFVPPLLHQVARYDAMAIEEEEARDTARRLAREEGIFAGTSTGLNVQAALRLAAGMKRDQVVVTVACDSGMKYLSTNLYG